MITEIRTPKPDEPVWLSLARDEMGVKEVEGLADNPRIIEYHSTCAMRAQSDEVPWCSAFANWVMWKCGIKGTGSAAARSWLKWGLECEPKKGAVVILKRGKSESQGHVGFCVAINPLVVSVLGGNQADSVCIKRYWRKDVLAYRWPRL